MKQHGYVLFAVMLISACITTLLISSRLIVINDLRMSQLFREHLFAN